MVESIHTYIACQRAVAGLEFGVWSLVACCLIIRRLEVAVVRFVR